MGSVIASESLTLAEEIFQGEWVWADEQESGKDGVGAGQTKGVPCVGRAESMTQEEWMGMCRSWKLHQAQIVSVWGGRLEIDPVNVGGAS